MRGKARKKERWGVNMVARVAGGGDLESFGSLRRESNKEEDRTRLRKIQKMPDIIWKLRWTGMLVCSRQEFTGCCISE